MSRTLRNTEVDELLRRHIPGYRHDLPRFDVAGFQARCEELFAEERVCDACAEQRESFEGTTEPLICGEHKGKRFRLSGFRR